jgi:hypothetical protein
MLSEFTAVPASILGIEMSACSSGASIWGPAFSKLKIDAHILHQSCREKPADDVAVTTKNGKSRTEDQFGRA